MTHFSEFLEWQLVRLNRSRQEIADLLGITPEKLDGWLAGGPFPSRCEERGTKAILEEAEPYRSLWVIDGGRGEAAQAALPRSPS